MLYRRLMTKFSGVQPHVVQEHKRDRQYTRVLAEPDYRVEVPEHDQGYDPYRSHHQVMQERGDSASSSQTWCIFTSERTRFSLHVALYGTSQDMHVPPYSGSQALGSFEQQVRRASTCQATAHLSARATEPHSIILCTTWLDPERQNIGFVFSSLFL